MPKHLPLVIKNKNQLKDESSSLTPVYNEGNRGTVHVYGNSQRVRVSMVVRVDGTGVLLNLSLSYVACLQEYDGGIF